MWQNQKIYSIELVFSCSDKFLIREKSDCIQKSGDTHSNGETWKQGEKKFEIRRSVEFSNATGSCIPWRVNGHSHRETSRYRRVIRGCGPFPKLGVMKMWQGTDCSKNIYRETPCIQSMRLPGRSKSWKDRMVTQSTRVSTHNSSYGSRILDRQGDLRTSAWWPYEWFGREYGYLGHISECHSSSSSSSWTRPRGEFTLREE